MSKPVHPEQQFAVEDIARIFRVPYWLIQGAKPSWLRRPLWRLRAWWWTPASRFRPVCALVGHDVPDYEEWCSRCGRMP